MCLGALVDNGVSLERIREVLETLPLDGWDLKSEKISRSGILATKVTVSQNPETEHPHRGLNDVLNVIEAGNLPPDVEDKARQVFKRLGEAEAHVHGVSVQEVHFHEVGAVDAICDVVGTVAGLHELGIDDIYFSTISLGGGTVEAAHGTLPVPAPATAELAKNIPTCGGPADCELATPTGVAIVTALGQSSRLWPPICLESVGYGAGTRQLDGIPNLLRLAVGETDTHDAFEADWVWRLECNIDDMTGEEVAFATKRLLGAGCLDAFVCPVQMKKGRPGWQLSALCSTELLRRIERIILKHTTTLGLRKQLVQRTKLRRSVENVTTRWGSVSVKLGWEGDKMVRCEPEFEDCRQIAEENDLSLREVYRVVVQAWENGQKD
jgi:hypothetical protein